eukprot:GILJ01004194.1.p1 GENE.GILJ01004194.1~~GILJ01004194.1.p1  ORF type:complete len:214 (+),score=31.95 GILJ01004194.1:45-686(+)
MYSRLCCVLLVLSLGVCRGVSNGWQDVANEDTLSKFRDVAVCTEETLKMELKNDLQRNSGVLSCQKWKTSCGFKLAPEALGYVNSSLQTLYQVDPSRVWTDTVMQSNGKQKQASLCVLVRYLLAIRKGVEEVQIPAAKWTESDMEDVDCPGGTEDGMQTELCAVTLDVPSDDWYIPMDGDALYVKGPPDLLKRARPPAPFHRGHTADPNNPLY